MNRQSLNLAVGLVGVTVAGFVLAGFQTRKMTTVRQLEDIPYQFNVDNYLIRPQ